jgi:hypothetical protein
LAQRPHAPRNCRTIEESHEAEQRELPLRQLAAAFQPLLVRDHHLECVPALHFRIGSFELHLVAPSDVPAVRLGEVASQELEAERVASDVLAQRFALALCTTNAELVEKVRAGGLRQVVEPPFLSRGLVETLQVDQGIARSHDA